jgi:hypothetical protein
MTPSTYILTSNSENALIEWLPKELALCLIFKTSFIWYFSNAFEEKL